MASLPGFVVPNLAVATFTPQARLMSTDLQIQMVADGLTGVASGCGVTAQGSPNMTLAVAAGQIIVGGVYAAVTAGNVTITTANATNPRIDLVIADASSKSVVAGTAAASPLMPDLPANSVALAAVYVPAGDTAIDNTQIIDKRMLTQDPRLLLINAQTGTAYTLVLADAFKLVTLTNASAITLTVPPNSSVAFPVGTVINAAQRGAGKVTVAPGAGVTVRTPAGGTLVTTGQLIETHCQSVATDEWDVLGNTS